MVSEPNRNPSSRSRLEGVPGSDLRTLKATYTAPEDCQTRPSMKLLLLRKPACCGRYQFYAVYPLRHIESNRMHWGVAAARGGPKGATSMEAGACRPVIGGPRVNSNEGST
jgi:hypothetical protein